MSLGKRLFAWMYHYLLSNRGHPDPDDPLTRDVRIPLLTQATGDVLEIGAGDGGNLTLYPPEIRLTLLEPNPYLRGYLEQACAAHRRGCAVVDGVGEALPFPDASFDTVVTTHVLCSVHDQARVLGEVRRVLRPGGRFLFMEHVAAHPGTRTYRLQRTINPLWKTVGDGCHLTRDTGATIRAAGFDRVEISAFEGSLPSVVSPHVSGVAWADSRPTAQTT